METCTSTDEPMDDDHREILKIVGKVLVKDMDAEEMLRIMSDSNVFMISERDREKIMTKGPTREEKCEVFLDIIPRTGAHAYDIFKEAIKKVRPHLLKDISKAGKLLKLRGDINEKPALKWGLVTLHQTTDRSSGTIYKKILYVQSDFFFCANGDDDGLKALTRGAYNA